MFNKIKVFWQNIRRLSGDDAYERYLQHYMQHQAEQQAENSVLENAEPPLSREAFFKQWQDKKWKGIKRCC